MSNKDIGSSFYEIQPNDPEYKALETQKVDFQAHHAYYYSGRNAILAILEDITSNNDVNAIWLPSYYCDTVINLITFHFNNIRYYPINPFEFDIDIDITAFSAVNDIVILNNFWGLSTFRYPENKSSRAIVIEDHSHGWLSKQCLNSKADYCVVSLRKNYPIPLGAIAWKPDANRGKLTHRDNIDPSILEAYDKFSRSLSLKRQYIKNQAKEVKSEYLRLLNEGENLLNHSNSYMAPDASLVNTIEELCCLNPNLIKNKHFQLVKDTINDCKHFKIVQRQSFTPFGLLLLFKDKVKFDSIKQWLISQNIYPAHLWPNIESDLEWKYLLNLHLDFRYNIEDMSYLVEKINIWIKNNV